MYTEKEKCGVDCETEHIVNWGCWMSENETTKKKSKKAHSDTIQTQCCKSSTFSSILSATRAQTLL